MSHEFRTPLTSVLGYSEQLREVRPDDAEVQRHLAAVTRGARHLLNLVENLLDQARIEVDRLQLNPGACELHELSDEVEQLLRPVAAQKQLSLAWWFDGAIPPRVWLDATRLKQVLINLVGNAIKFTRQGGVSVEFEWQDGRLRVSVTDTGPGIAPEDAATVFEPFRQVGDTQQAKGAGLGLAISQSLVRAMGGEITLTSRQGEGARFAFEIDAASVQGGRAGGHPASLAGRKVLVADDDPDLLELLRLYLGAAGCRTETVGDAAAALNAARRLAPDVVLLDLNLGDQPGTAVAERLRASGYAKPIVILSATAPGDDTADARDGAAIDARWTKPISRAQLLEGLAGLIG
jgi:CheY-like chemotaxis protein